MKRLYSILALVLVLTLSACDSSPTAPMCVAPTATAKLDVETCVDHQELGICRWAAPDVGTAPVAGCSVPSGIDQGVTCVDQCPANHYERAHEGTCTALTDYAPQRLDVKPCPSDASKATCAWFEGTTGDPMPVSSCNPMGGVECVTACQ